MADDVVSPLTSYHVVCTQDGVEQVSFDFEQDIVGGLTFCKEYSDTISGGHTVAVFDDVEAPLDTYVWVNPNTLKGVKLVAR